MLGLRAVGTCCTLTDHRVGCRCRQAAGVGVGSVAGECLQFADQGVRLREQIVRRRRAARDVVDQLAHVVAHAQEEGNEIAADGDVARTHVVEHVLGVVRERHHVVEAEEAGRPLDRVRGAEDRVDQVFIFRRLFDAQEGVLHRFEQLAAFDDVGVEGFVKIHGRSRDE